MEKGSGSRQLSAFMMVVFLNLSLKVRVGEKNSERNGVVAFRFGKKSGSDTMVDLIARSFAV